MRNIVGFLVMLWVCSSCMKGIKVDLIVHNARIHTMDDAGSMVEAMAIKDGKVVEVGPERQILNKYRADRILDAQKKDVYPGFTDAHGHLFAYARQKLGVDLFGVSSWAAVLDRVNKHHLKNQRPFIIGRGWDQSLWGSDVMPSNKALNEAFPTIPVALYRVDGHAVLVNDCLLKKAGITHETTIEGGKIITSGAQCTGLLLDNAMDRIKPFLPDYAKDEYERTLLEIQDELLSFGITGVHEAGITQRELSLLRDLNHRKKLKLAVYAMLMANQENLTFAKEKGIFNEGKLSVRSFKLYLDGALGSRGALLKRPYSDDASTTGILITRLDSLSYWMDQSLSVGYQLNTHAIGDSANKLVLEAYKKAYDKVPDHRWRIEHAQVVDPSDWHLFRDHVVFPSVQPSHAVSDQRWAAARLGEERLLGAYAYFSLYKAFGMLALGTDFPVEPVNPFNTIRSAVLRQDKDNFPAKGFLPTEALSLELVLKGMTIWPQFAAFAEGQRGMLMKGYEATFILLDKPMTDTEIPVDNFSLKTFILGKEEFSVEG
ncbi:MAG: amidohydrolase [Flavobacteriales bacterium]